MSFSVVLQTNSSENEKLTKTLSNITTCTGVLKNESSIIDPVILIEGDIAALTGCNYMTIAAFGRMYFVTDIISIKNNLIEISGHVDVLSSYAAQIRSNRAIVRKQQNAWNLYLNDGTFKVYQNPLVITKTFPSGFTDTEFVLAVAGG